MKRPWFLQHRYLSNQKGQLSIFVALIFQVLFVLFAMGINVALVVHDKINLQNAVDLAAYYGAQRQAELLNAIAHSNYQVRQSWKLLAWRYRVLGSMGMSRPEYIHPARRGDTVEESYFIGQYGTNPPTCVTYAPNWVEVNPQENLCNDPNLQIPPLPPMRVIIGFPFNLAAKRLTDRLIEQFNMACAYHGAYNWWFAASILQAYREDMRNRRQVMMGLARGLSSSADDITDLRGESTRGGAFNTLIKNLTTTNREGFESFEFYNSLGHPSLQGQPPEDTWLPLIQINPTLMYTDARDVDGCSAIMSTLIDLPRKPAALDRLNNSNLDPDRALRNWYGPQGHDPVFTSDYYFNLGVEKNPWYMAYVGVKATSRPRQIFFPFGPRVTVTARAYAKPFGGRIGPWYSHQWPSGASRSQGNKVDILLPPRVDENGMIGGADIQDPSRFPNYSRFPGDTLGLKSRGALNSLRGAFDRIKMHYSDFQDIKAEHVLGEANDPLAWDVRNDRAAQVRFFEIAAIVPDIFDITYYSIEPNYTENYLQFLVANREQLGIPPRVPLRGDLGSRGEDMNMTILEQFQGVQEDQTHLDHAFYFIRNIYHVLTAWLPNFENNLYQGPDQYFGACETPIDMDKEFRIPGHCLNYGGRTGYSVKLVSRDMLLSSELPLGGGFNSSLRGPILNPPPIDMGW